MIGLIQKLTLIYNISTFAETSSSSPPALNSNVFNPIQYDNESFFASAGNSEDGEWWQVSFKNISINLNSFRVRSYFNGVGQPHMKIFNLSAGTREDSLEVIYHETGANELNKPYGEKIFDLRRTFGPFSVFRITSLDTFNSLNNNSFDHVIRISQFDVYGSLRGPLELTALTCNHLNLYFYENSANYHFLYLLIILI